MNKELIVQVGEKDPSVCLYLEDYVYSYWKRFQEEAYLEMRLYGESKEENIPAYYVYGAGKTMDCERFFSSYSYLGNLEKQQDKIYLYTVEGKYIELQGYYIFYTDNPAMQDFLIQEEEDQGLERIDKLPERKRKTYSKEEALEIIEKPMLFSHSPKRRKKKRKTFPMAVSFVLLLSLGTFLLPLDYSAFWNFLKQAEQVSTKNNSDWQLEIVEEQKQPEDITLVDEEKEEWSSAESIQKMDEELPEIPEAVVPEEISQEERPQEETLQPEDTQQELQNYVVKEGDTLAAICIKNYGDLTHMQSICEYNQIKDANRIKPGQVLILP